MKPPDMRAAALSAQKNGRVIRNVGDVPGYDLVMLEDRESGERRKVPQKYLMMCGGDYRVAFEMVPAGPGFENTSKDA